VFDTVEQVGARAADQSKLRAFHSYAAVGLDREHSFSLVEWVSMFRRDRRYSELVVTAGSQGTAYVLREGEGQVGQFDGGDGAPPTFTSSKVR